MAQPQFPPSRDGGTWFSRSSDCNTNEKGHCHLESEQSAAVTATSDQSVRLNCRAKLVFSCFCVSSVKQNALAALRSSAHVNYSYQNFVGCCEVPVSNFAFHSERNTPQLVLSPTLSLTYLTFLSHFETCSSAFACFVCDGLASPRARLHFGRTCCPRCTIPKVNPPPSCSLQSAPGAEALQPDEPHFHVQVSVRPSLQSTTHQREAKSVPMAIKVVALFLNIVVVCGCTTLTRGATKHRLRSFCGTQALVRTSGSLLSPTNEHTLPPYGKPACKTGDALHLVEVTQEELGPFRDNTKSTTLTAACCCSRRYWIPGVG